MSKSLKTVLDETPFDSLNSTRVFMRMMNETSLLAALDQWEQMKENEEDPEEQQGLIVLRAQKGPGPGELIGAQFILESANFHQIIDGTANEGAIFVAEIEAPAQPDKDWTVGCIATVQFQTVNGMQQKKPQAEFDEEWQAGPSKFWDFTVQFDDTDTNGHPEYSMHLAGA